VSEPKRLVAFFPKHEISVSVQGEELKIDYPDFTDRRIAEEAGQFVQHLVDKEVGTLTRIQATEDWERLDAAFDKWLDARGLRRGDAQEQSEE